MKRRHLITIGIIASILFIAGVEPGLPQAGFRPDPRKGFGRGRQHASFWAELTEAQQTELKEMIQAMRDDSTTREEIRDVVHAKLEEWGVEPPEHPRVIDRLENQLTEEQKAELEALTQEMKENGAKPDEIRDAVHAKMEEWDVKPPLAPSFYKMQGAPHSRHFSRGGGMHSIQPMHRGPSNCLFGHLRKAGEVTVSIYNAQGKLIREFDAGFQQTGPIQILWNGKTDKGKDLPAGMYSYKITAGKDTIDGRILLID